MSVSVLLADDHLVVRAGVRAVLEAEPDIDVVGEVKDGAEVADAYRRLRPDVLVLDLMMPRRGGLQVLQDLQTLAERPRVVVLSMFAAEAYVTEALRLGALGYVVKDSGAGELATAVRQVGAGRRFLSPLLSEAIIEAYARRLDASSQDPYDRLTPREREILILIAQGRTNAEVGTQLSISPRTAESHRANLMMKLGLRTQTDLIRYALRRGLLQPGF